MLGSLLAPLLAPGRLPAGWHVTDWEVEQGITLALAGPGGALDVEVEGIDAARPCYARTRRFNVYYGTRGRNQGLSSDERAALDVVVAVLTEREVRLPVLARPDGGDRVQVRRVEVDRVLMPDGPGAYYVNPYVGCMLACPFCYAQHRADFSRSLAGLPSSAWGKWVDVKVNAAAVLQAELARHAPGVVRMSPIVTDPYQPIERKFRITRACLSVVADTQFVPVVLTRSSSVLEDLPLLARAHRARVGVSIPTDDDAVRDAFEPSTEPIAARLATLRALRRDGIETFAVVQPMLPLDPERLVASLAPWVSAVRLGPLVEKERIRAIHERLGRHEELGDDWERSTFERLKSGFEARGVQVNPEGPEWR